MDFSKGSTLNVSNYLLLLLLAASPLVAQQAVDVNAVDVTKPVMVCSFLLLWPLKSWLTCRMLQCPYLRSLRAHFFSTIIAFFIYGFWYSSVFTLVEKFFLWKYGIDYNEGRPDVWYVNIFYLNSVNRVQWEVIVMTILITLALCIPITLMEVIQLRKYAPAANTMKLGKTLTLSNIAFFAFLTLINVVALIMVMRNSFAILG